MYDLILMYIIKIWLIENVGPWFHLVPVPWAFLLAKAETLHSPSPTILVVSDAGVIVTEAPIRFPLEGMSIWAPILVYLAVSRTTATVTKTEDRQAHINAWIEFTEVLNQ